LAAGAHRLCGLRQRRTRRLRRPENHAYDASFTPLEGTENTYLQNLPSQGALLTNYYGTGHSSLDNYLSMVSGQAPVSDDQDD
jgi:hypothetical protein